MVRRVGAELREVMTEVRDRAFGLVGHLDDDQLTAVHSPIMSPLAWDLGHVAAYEDLWLNHRLAGGELLRAELAALYDAFETPERSAATWSSCAARRCGSTWPRCASARSRRR